MRQHYCGLFVQPDEKSDGTICTNDLISVSLFVLSEICKPIIMQNKKIYNHLKQIFLLLLLRSLCLFLRFKLLHKVGCVFARNKVGVGEYLYLQITVVVNAVNIKLA